MSLNMRMGMIVLLLLHSTAFISTMKAVHHIILSFANNITAENGDILYFDQNSDESSWVAAKISK